MELEADHAGVRLHGQLVHLLGHAQLFTST